MLDDLKKIKRDLVENRLVLDLSKRSLFGNEAGEDEKPEVLDSYFLDVNNSNDFFNESEEICVVSGRKGMGKSSILSRLQYKLTNKKDTIVIKTTGNELLGLGNFENKDQAYLENYWKQIICKKVNLEIGSNIGFAVNNDEIMMVEQSEVANMKSKNFIGSLLDRFKTKINALDVEVEISNRTLPSNWENLLDNYQSNNKNSFIWVLIDDIDAKFINNKEYQERVGSFFTAIRSLAIGIDRLNIRATTRSDVWNSLDHIEDLDKWDQYIFEIKWTRNQMRNILAKRILAYIKREFPDKPESKYSYTEQYISLFNIVFKEKMNWIGRQTSFYEPILIYANGRPRWMGQLCRLAAMNANSMDFNRISETNLINILEKFGKNRIADFKKEHIHQFEYVQELVDIFRAGERHYNKEDLENKIKNSFLNKFQSVISFVDGEPYIKVEQLGNFLYKIGFLATKEQDNFKNFDDKPDLYLSNENNLNNIRWEIHPSYRNYLNIR